jgi:hypothetical protein
MTNALQTGRHSLAERGHDVYETPDVAVRALLRIEKLPKIIWEPACGPGAIVRELRAAGHAVIATDLIDYGCPNSAGGFDFLSLRHAPKGCECIVTNPPFKDVDAFVRRALALVPTVAMLMRLAFLEGGRRSDIVDGGRLRRVHVFKHRLPMMHRHGWTGPKATSMAPFAWFVWCKQKGRIVVDRIDRESTLSA